MNYSEFNERKKVLLFSSHSIQHEMGVGYKLVEDEYKKSARAWLSEDVDLSECAKRVYDSEEKSYDRDGNNAHRIHMAAASELFVKTMGLDETKRLLRIRGIRTFDEAKSSLGRDPTWTRLHPLMVKEALGEVRGDDSEPSREPGSD